MKACPSNCGRWLKPCPCGNKIYLDTNDCSWQWWRLAPPFWHRPLPALSRNLCQLSWGRSMGVKNWQMLPELSLSSDQRGFNRPKLRMGLAPCWDNGWGEVAHCSRVTQIFIPPHSRSNTTGGFKSLRLQTRETLTLEFIDWLDLSFDLCSLSC